MGGLLQRPGRGASPDSSCPGEEVPSRKEMRSPSPIFYVLIYFLRIPEKGYSVRPSHCVCVWGGDPVESHLRPHPKLEGRKLL